MPNTASAKKRLRQSLVRRDRNRRRKSALRSQIKKVFVAINAGDVAKAEEQFRVAAKQLDQAGAAKVIHPNAAGRYKSRLQRAIVKIKQAG
jgi:small subunit ribosomal protein S20